MASSNINLNKVFWICFLIGLLFPIVFMFVVAKVDGYDFMKQLTRLIKSPLDLFRICVSMSAIPFATFCCIMAWIKKRNKKMEEKDELNELMRKYLEKKMREEK